MRPAVQNGRDDSNFDTPANAPLLTVEMIDTFIHTLTPHVGDVWKGGNTFIHTPTEWR